MELREFLSVLEPDTGAWELGLLVTRADGKRFRSIGADYYCMTTAFGSQDTSCLNFLSRLGADPLHVRKISSAYLTLLCLVTTLGISHGRDRSNSNTDQ
jgi:hypothetical protein